jgi:glycosyltransferase involved in cell wall biosynthesis
VKTNPFVIFVASIEVPSEGGLSSNIINRRMILKQQGINSHVVSKSNIPKIARTLLVDIPCFILSKTLKFGAAMYRHKVLKWLLSILVENYTSSMENVVVFSHDIVSFDASYKLCKDQEHRLILFVHDYYSATIAGHAKMNIRNPEISYLRKLEYYAYNNASIIFGVDSRIARYIENMQEGNKAKPRVLLNAPNLLIFDSYSEYNKKTNMDSYINKYVILVPRRLYPKNGVRYVIESLAEEIMEDIPAILVIVGSGPELPLLRSIAKKIGVDQSVRFTGSKPHSQMPKFYALSDVVVIPSITHLGVQEASSISALEAMAASRPVIASRIGGLVEIINDGENGYLVAEKDTKQLAKALADIWHSPERTQRIVQKGLESVIRRVQEFSDTLVSLVLNNE